MKGKIKFIQEKGEWSNSSGTFNKYQVQFDDGKSYQFLAKGDFKRKVGDFVEYEVTNQQYGTAKLIYTQPPAAPNKDVTISKLACLKAAAEFNAGRPQSDRVSVVEDAKHFYNWIIS